MVLIGLIKFYDWLKRTLIRHLVHTLQTLPTFMPSYFLPHRSDKVARAHKSPLTVQHPLKDPATTCGHQGCKTAVEGNEEGKGVPYHI